MGVRVDHRQASLPDPTPALINCIAQGLHETHREQLLREAVLMGVDRDTANTRTPRWQDLDDTRQDDWREMARLAYGIIAERGGGVTVFRAAEG